MRDKFWARYLFKMSFRIGIIIILSIMLISDDAPMFVAFGMLFEFVVHRMSVLFFATSGVVIKESNE